MKSHDVMSGRIGRSRKRAAVLFAAWLAACAPNAARPPAVPEDDAAFATDAEPAAPGMDETDDAEADRVHAGDTVTVTYVGNKDLTGATVAIDRAGDLHLPLVGDVHVGGATIAEAERKVQEGLLRFDRFTRVTLTLAETKGRVATVTGAVERPGNVPIVGDARLADVLSSVGGPRLFAANERVTALGDIDGTRVMRGGKRLPVDARRAMEGEPRHNVRIRPGDVIVVPPALAGRIVVLGHVGKPQTIAYRKGMRLTEALADSGGLVKSSDAADVRILRGGYARPRLFVANAKDVLSGARPDVVLAPGDVIYVSEHWFASVGDVLERVIPVAATGLLVGSVVK